MTRGWGPWKKRWYSFCSFAHEDPECPRCQAGSWHYVWADVVSGAIYRRWPGLWRMWANR